MATIQELKQQQGAAAAEESPLAPFLRMNFNPDVWHAMNSRNDMQVQSEIMHGPADSEFVYAMLVQGKLITGVGVTGARQIAVEYGGIKSRLIASTEKKGALFIFRQFYPLVIQTGTLHELQSEPDYYEAVVEVSDIKTGNSITVRKSEDAKGTRTSGGEFDKLHYDTIAESKAYRNGVLSLVPQSTIRKFKIKCLDQAVRAGAFDADKDKALKAAIQRYVQAEGNPALAGAEQTLDQLREGCLKFCAKNAIGIDKVKLMNLTYEEIWGLGEAAKQTIDAFRGSAVALGLMQGAPGDDGAGKTTTKEGDAGTTKSADKDKTPPPPRSRRGGGSGSGSAIE